MFHNVKLYLNELYTFILELNETSCFEVEHRLCQHSQSLSSFYQHSVGSVLNMCYWFLRKKRKLDPLLDQSPSSSTLLVEDERDSQVSGKLPVLSCEVFVPLANNEALAPWALHFLPVLISWPSTQTSALLDFLYCSISSALMTLCSGQEKFLIQAAPASAHSSALVFS